MPASFIHTHGFACVGPHSLHLSLSLFDPEAFLLPIETFTEAKKRHTFPVSYGGKRKVKIWEAMQPAQSVIIIDNLKAL